MRDKIMKMGSQPDLEYEVSIEYTNVKEMHLNDKIDDEYKRIDNITGKPTSRSNQ